MFPFGKRKSKSGHKIDEATKAEMRRLMSGIEQSQRSKYPRLLLFFKMGTGYAAMAVFTMASLTFSALSLYGIHNTAREMAYIDLPAINSLNHLRTSLLAQENFAGKYAILKDRTFIDLFRQREKETLATIEVLEKTGAADEVQELKRLYREYHLASARLFSGKSESSSELRPIVLKLLGTVDGFSVKRQEMLQAVVDRADYLRQETMKWSIIISCSGFILAIVMAFLITYRIYGTLKRLQTATNHLAAGNFQYDAITPVGEELSELAVNFTKIAERLRTLEEMRAEPAAAAVADGKGVGKGDAANGGDEKP